MYAPSSLASSLASSAGAAPPAAAPPAAGAAPPPEPTLVRRSLTSLPSRACHKRIHRQHLQVPNCLKQPRTPAVDFRCGSSIRDGVSGIDGRTLAKREVQMGSISTLLALIRACSLSACDWESTLAPSCWRESFCDTRWDWRDQRNFFCAYGDLETLISEDEGGVGRCQLSGRHCEMCSVVAGCRKLRVSNCCAASRVDKLGLFRG